MNADQANSFQKLLEHACDKFISEGGKIGWQFFQIADRKCPIVCLGGFNGQIRDTVAQTITNVKSVIGYQMSPNEVYQFIYAFDGNSLYQSYDGNYYVAAYLIGKELREKYIQP